MSDKNGKIVIEKGISIPNYSLEGPLPFADMEVGDSFFVTDRSINSLTTRCGYWKRKLDRSFICRTIDGGVRVWRVK